MLGISLTSSRKNYFNLAVNLDNVLAKYIIKKRLTTCRKQYGTVTVAFVFPRVQIFPSTKLQDLQENKTNWFPEWPDIRCFIPRPSLQTVTIEWIKTVRTMSVLFKLYNNRTLIPRWSVLCSSTKVKTGSFIPTFCHTTFHHALITY